MGCQKLVSKYWLGQFIGNNHRNDDKSSTISKVNFPNTPNLAICFPCVSGFPHLFVEHNGPVPAHGPKGRRLVGLGHRGSGAAGRGCAASWYGPTRLDFCWYDLRSTNLFLRKIADFQYFETFVWVQFVGKLNMDIEKHQSCWRFFLWKTGDVQCLITRPDGRTGHENHHSWNRTETWMKSPVFFRIFFFIRTHGVCQEILIFTSVFSCSISDDLAESHEKKRRNNVKNLCCRSLLGAMVNPKMLAFAMVRNAEKNIVW